MKVLCVIDADQAYEPKVVIGNLYTVVRVVRKELHPKKEFYELKETGSSLGFWVGMFAPLSDIDEMELVNSISEPCTV